MTKRTIEQSGSKLPIRSRTRAPRRKTAPTSPAAVIRLLLLDACRDADGQPRVALNLPGTSTPKVYPTLAAALAAKARLEAGL